MADKVVVAGTAADAEGAATKLNPVDGGPAVRKVARRKKKVGKLAKAAGLEVDAPEVKLPVLGPGESERKLEKPIPVRVGPRLVRAFVTALERPVIDPESNVTEEKVKGGGVETVYIVERDDLEGLKGSFLADEIAEVG